MNSLFSKQPVGKRARKYLRNIRPVFEFQKETNTHYILSNNHNKN